MISAGRYGYHKQDIAALEAKGSLTSAESTTLLRMRAEVAEYERTGGVAPPEPEPPPTDTPVFVWGEDARVEMRGPNVFILLLKPDLIWRIATSPTGPLPGLMKKVRRTSFKGSVSYELMWASYPHAIPPELTPGRNPSMERLLGQQSVGRMYVDPRVADEMIRDGKLVMRQSPDTYQQDLFWAQMP